MNLPTHSNPAQVNLLFTESQIPSEEHNILASENNTYEEQNTVNSATSNKNNTSDEQNTERSASSNENNPSHEQNTENSTENHIENSERIIVNMATGTNLKKFSGSENVHF